MAARRPLRDEAALLSCVGADLARRERGGLARGVSRAPAHWRRRRPSSLHRNNRRRGRRRSRAAPRSRTPKIALAEANREYERRFGRIFIVCATGKTSAEILAILRQRLQNDDATELREAAEQQRQITQLRLRKWLRG